MLMLITNRRAIRNNTTIKIFGPLPLIGIDSFLRRWIAGWSANDLELTGYISWFFRLDDAFDHCVINDRLLGNRDTDMEWLNLPVRSLDLLLYAEACYPGCGF